MRIHPSLMRRVGRSRTALIAVLAVPIALASASSLVKGLSNRQPVVPPSSVPVVSRAVPGPVPVALEYSLPLLKQVDPAVARRLADRFRPTRVKSLPDLLHVLRTLGRDTTGPGSQGQPLIDAILSEGGGRWFDGHSLLIRTREGVRCRVADRGTGRKQPERQSHEDLLLATLGELGFARSYAMATESGTATVNDLINDATAKFDPKQREIEWSSLGLTLYLALQPGWKDRFDNDRSFDALAEELVSRTITEETSCSGTHLMYSLSALLNVDARAPFLSPSSRERAETFRSKMVRAALDSQAADGSWPPAWHTGKPSAAAEAEPAVVRVLSTGHQLEWLSLLPKDQALSEERSLRAANWLRARLEEATDAQLDESFCPYSHAARMLLILTGQYHR